MLLFWWLLLIKLNDMKKAGNCFSCLYVVYCVGIYSDMYFLLRLDKCLLGRDNILWALFLLLQVDAERWGGGGFHDDLGVAVESTDMHLSVGTVDRALGIFEGWIAIAPAEDLHAF